MITEKQLLNTEEIIQAVRSEATHIIMGDSSNEDRQADAFVRIAAELRVRNEIELLKLQKEVNRG